MNSYLRLICISVLFILPFASFAQQIEWEEVDTQEPTPGNWISWQLMAAADAAHVVVHGNLTNMGTYIRGTSDSGRTWQMIWQDTIITDFDVQPPIVAFPKRIFSLSMPGPNHVVAIGDSGYVWTTFNFGKSWKSIRLGDPTSHLSHVSFSDSLFGLVYQLLPKQRWWASTDGGDTWTEKMDIDTTFVPPGKILNLIRTCTPERWYVHLSSNSDHLMALTTDAGRTWKTRSVATTVDLFVLDTLDAWTAGSAFLSSSGDLAYDVISRTTDGGEHWETLFNNYLPAEPHFGSLAVAFADRNNGFVTGRANRIFHTTDGGMSWKATMDGLPDLELFAMSHVVYPAPDIAYVISVRGRIFRWIGQTTDVNERNIQEYPEIASTLIELQPGSAYALHFALQRRERLSIALFDLTGRQMKVLAETQMFEAGDHSLSFDVSSLPSGNYVVVTQSENQTISTPVAIVR